MVRILYGEQKNHYMIFFLMLKLLFACNFSDKKFCKIFISSGWINKL